MSKEKIKVVYVEKKETKFPDGVDWHILGVDCDCGQDILPIADNAGEDINLYEEMQEHRGKKCENCGKYFRLLVEEGNMASKRKAEKELVETAYEEALKVNLHE